MGLRCLMGHDFGDVLTERDRHERGDEVVVTVREFRECDRCGETRVLSENKEVRHATGTESTSTGGEGASDGVPTEDVGDVADDVYEDVSAEEDDGVILVDDPDELDESDDPDEREPTPWPEPADEREPAVEEGGTDEEPTPWPEVEGEDEGYAAEPSDGAPVDGVQFGSGLTPEAPEAPVADAGGSPTARGDDGIVESGAGADADGDRGGFRRSSSLPARSGSQRAIAAETELLCPECEHTAPTQNSSLRPGDICPECRLGYLAERER